MSKTKSGDYSLLIVESPSKAKTIEKYLSDLGNYKVVASIGHIRDLPKSNKDAIDVEGGFVPRYVVSPGKDKVIHSLEKFAENADEVLLATDPDREGEAIAWHIAEALKLKKPKRVVFNEITKEAILEAVQNPRSIDMHLKEAQEARRVLDRLVGYDLSGLIWKKVRYGLSAGRVQSPALRIIMEREREIRAFIPETFWVIEADLENKSKAQFKVTCDEEPRDHALVERILNEGKTGSWIVKDIKESQAKRAPRAPFITSTLQQTASTRLSFSPSRTMKIAQRLYEAGHITYMRTDSTNLSNQALGQIANFIKKEYGSEYYQTRVFGKKSKNAQEAHEAIRPTHINKKSAGLNTEQKELYDLIWRRTIASQMTDAQVMRTKITTQIENTDLPTFSVNGSRLMYDGWLKADPRSRGEDVEVPKLTQGENLNLIDITNIKKETQPPSRYSEAGLIKELEKRGIGRPSTYASIMQTLVDRGYVERENRTLIPTDTGDVVSSFLEDHFMNYINDSFTAEMENELDEIANGEREYVATLKNFYGPFTKDLKSKEKIEKITNLGDADAKHVCPKCGSKMQIKLGKNGKFLSCSKFPDCTGALTIDGKEMGNEKPIGNHPQTGEPIFSLNGRFGPYVQLGLTPEKPTKKQPKGEKTPSPRRASIPKGINPEEITLEQAVHLLILPREIGKHPETGHPVISNIGRFGPYVGHDGEFRSLKEDSPYDVTLEKALEILAKPKQAPRGAEIIKTIGKNPRTKKEIVLYKSKSGYFLKKGLKRFFVPDNVDAENLSVETAIELMK